MAKSKILQWPLGTLDFSNGCLIMGVLNITPDSFSDGGDYLDVEKAVAHALEMVQQGAAIIDVGPESSRPGSDPVSVDLQVKRAVPVIKKLARQVNVPVSIDTTEPVVAAAAIDMGASIVNDITAMSSDRMAELVAERNTLAILMHMKDRPKTMQNEPHYSDVTREVKSYLLSRAKHARQYGISRDHIIIDPGIGFGKTTMHNLHLLRDIDQFVETEYRVLVGASRKRFIGEITGKEIPKDRIFGTAAAVAHCAAAGVSIVRVHDVDQMKDVIKVSQAIIKGR